MTHRHDNSVKKANSSLSASLLRPHEDDQSEEAYLVNKKKPSKAGKQLPQAAPPNTEKLSSSKKLKPQMAITDSLPPPVPPVIVVTAPANQDEHGLSMKQSTFTDTGHAPLSGHHRKNASFGGTGSSDKHPPAHSNTTQASKLAAIKLQI